MFVLELALVAALIILNGLLALSELAIVSSRAARLRNLVERNVAGSRRALTLHSDPGKFLSTVQIGITMVGVLSGAFSGATLGVRLATWLDTHGVSDEVANPLGMGLVVAAITYFSLIVGELVPKQIALRNPEKVALRVAPAMTILARVASPLVTVLDGSGRILLWIMGYRQQPAEKVTDEEIRSLIAEAERSGTLEPGEKEMITGVMRLADRPVGGLMTPRTDVDMLDLSLAADEIRARISASPHSRLPVHEGNPDEPIGVLQSKDILNALITDPNPDIRSLVREAPIIPESVDARDVVGTLKTAPVHMALVHDEYGHFKGVVTPADILEAIVGSFTTEEGPAEPAAVKRNKDSYLVSGWMPVDEFADLIGITVPDDRSYNTVAGFVLDGFGALPEVGNTFDAHGWRFEVVDLDGRRVDKVMATRLPKRRRAAA
jgi:putative hemolysin